MVAFFILLRQSLVSQQFLGSIGSLFLLLVVGNVVEILLISSERREGEKMEEKLDKQINVKRIMAIRKDHFILISLSLPRSTVLSAAFLMIERFFFQFHPDLSHRIRPHCLSCYTTYQVAFSGMSCLSLSAAALFWSISDLFDLLFSSFRLHSGCRQDAVADDRVWVKRRRRMDGTFSSNLHIDEVTDSIRNLPILKGLWTELCQICRAHEGCWDKMKKRKIVWNKLF